MITILNPLQSPELAAYSNPNPKSWLSIQILNLLQSLDTRWYIALCGVVLCRTSTTRQSMARHDMTWCSTGWQTHYEAAQCSAATWD